jgi:hypothetical protein
MLDEAPDLSVRVITAGAGTWLIHGEIFLLSIALAFSLHQLRRRHAASCLFGCGVVSEARYDQTQKSAHILRWGVEAIW